eukprot:GFYU01006813.1.p1 GENE.GFYU01006813.1~~GFYU01006813.1.p1  ORF type:complete len:194 (-),score=46.50 GFYU01006813.1:148-654(-)
MLQKTTVEDLMRLHVWQTEHYLRKCSDSTRRTGHNVETVIYIIDAERWHLGLATQGAYKFLKTMAEVDGTHYPERLGKVLVVNSPSGLAIAWRIVRTWLDPITKAKVDIVKGRDQFLPILLEMMDEDQIPVEYGGTARSRKYDAYSKDGKYLGYDTAYSDTEILSDKE